jgi:RimJ/RimL family protein N-acetyltransferase
MIEFIRGTQAYLRPIERSDYTDVMPTWLSDRDATRYLTRGTFPLTRDDLSAAFDEVRSSHADCEFAVVAIDDDSPVGVAGLHALNWVARSAEFRVFVGDRSHWSKGIGTETAQLLVAYAFDVLNLNRVWLGVNSENLAALTTYERTGFTREGLLRDDVYRNGRYYDVVRMGLLRREYDVHAPTWAIHEDLCRQLRGSA